MILPVGGPRIGGYAVSNQQFAICNPHTNM